MCFLRLFWHGCAYNTIYIVGGKALTVLHSVLDNCCNNVTRIEYTLVYSISQLFHSQQQHVVDFGIGKFVIQYFATAFVAYGVEVTQNA